MGIRPTLSLSAKQATYVAEANSPCGQNPGLPNGDLLKDDKELVE